MTPLGRRYASLPSLQAPNSSEIEAIRSALTTVTSPTEDALATAVTPQGALTDTLCLFPVHIPFAKTAATYVPSFSGAEFEPPRDVPQPQHLPLNPQTQSLLGLLGLLQAPQTGIERVGDTSLQTAGLLESAPLPPLLAPPPDPAEIDLD